MRVLFLQDLKGQGKKGEIRDMNEGYARNFLLPKKIAVIASQEVLKDLHREARLEQESSSRVLARTKKLAQQLQAQKIYILHASVNQKGRLFAPVSALDVARVVNKHFPGAVTQRQVVFQEKITEPGTFSVNVDLGMGVIAEISLLVTSKNV